MRARACRYSSGDPNPSHCARHRIPPLSPERRWFASLRAQWDHIEHADSGGTLALLEGKLGVLQLLQEQCRLPKGDDHNFCDAVRSTQSDHASLLCPKLPASAFGIRHYAGLVTYSSVRRAGPRRSPPARAPSTP